MRHQQNHRVLRAAAGLLGLLALPAADAQGPPPLGDEFQVNTYTTGGQAPPAVAADGAGNFVVVWHGGGQEEDFGGVFGQRYDAAGNPVGAEFHVNTWTTGAQWYAEVATDGAGNFVVVWESVDQDGSGPGVFGQLHDAAGNPVGAEFQVNTYTTGSQRYADVATDGAGNFVVVWHSYAGNDGSGYGVFCQRYDAAGNPVGAEFQVNTYTTGSQIIPAVAADGAGNVVVVWGGDGQEDSPGVFGQRYDAAGNPVGAEFQVNTYTPGGQGLPAVATDGAGNFVVVWTSGDQDGSGYGVFGQRYDAAGNPVGAEFQVNTYTTRYQFGSAVAADGAGNFVVVWGSGDQDGSGYGAFGQLYDAAGNPVGAEFQANTYTTGWQISPAVATDGSGRFVVAWRSDFQDGSGPGVFGQRFRWLVFADGFESGDTAAWGQTVP